MGEVEGRSPPGGALLSIGTAAVAFAGHAAVGERLDEGLLGAAAGAGALATEEHED